MTLDITTLHNDFVETGFAIAPNLFTRDEVQRLKSECIDILAAVKRKQAQSPDTVFMWVWRRGARSSKARLAMHGCLIFWKASSHRTLSF